MTLSKLTHKAKIDFLLVIAYMTLIFYLSSIPLEFPEIINELDPTKFSLHLAEYTILGFLLFNAKKNFNFSFLVSSLYGLSDEVHQYFVPYRTFSLFDLLADMIGSLFGIVIFLYLQRTRFYKRFKLNI